MPANTKRALVTGASRGIGKATALALADAGYDVAVSARTVRSGESRDNATTIHATDTRPLPGSLEETAEAIRAAGREALIVPLDLTDRVAVQSAADRILQDWGGVDVLVHNGRYIGPGLMDLLLDIPLDAYEKFFEAHFIAPVVLTKALLPGMVERGSGTIVTVTSGAGHQIPPAPAGKGGWGLGYAVGKAAGHTLVPTVHVEFGSRGIRAFNVEPGFVATERSVLIVRDLGFDPDAGAPPAAIGAAIAWLVTSPEADAMSGQTVPGQALCRERSLYPEW
jgi:NAD(P)-dependent dehydrogenase (short-subunit alcohol dehydrogenase family)